MFTGLVEEMGTVVDRVERNDTVVFAIRGRRAVRNLKKGDSISVEGVCLTVLRRLRNVVSVQVVEETLGKTTLGNMKRGSKVNLERPMRADAMVGGHFVLGHVDCTGVVVSVRKRNGSWIFTISIPPRFRKYVIPVGSIAVNGVSLTVARRNSSNISVSIIPHTWAVTTFQTLNEGDRVNLEFDVLGKYALNASHRRKSP